MTATATTAEKHELVVTRTLDAPRALVFKAWTQPEHLARWLGRGTFKAGAYHVDFRPGGTYRASIYGMEGSEHKFFGTYREIVEPERLVFTFAWDGKGPELARESLVTLTFVEIGDKTKMTLRQAYFATAESRDDHGQGWNECIDKLAGYLATGMR